MQKLSKLFVCAFVIGAGFWISDWVLSAIFWFNFIWDSPHGPNNRIGRSIIDRMVYIQSESQIRAAVSLRN